MSDNIEHRAFFEEEKKGIIETHFDIHGHKSFEKFQEEKILFCESIKQEVTLEDLKNNEIKTTEADS